MAFLLNGQPLAVDTPFTDASGTQYSALFLRHSTLEEKQAIGITEVPDPPAPPDSRFYWGLDASGAPIPRDADQVKTTLIQQAKTTAGTLLLPTDWMIVRQVETGDAVPDTVLAYRKAVRDTSNAYEEAVLAARDVEALAALQVIWPSMHLDG